MATWDAAQWGVNIGTAAAAIAGCVQAWRAGRAARKGTTETETVVRAVEPDGELDRRIGQIDRDVRDLRVRMVDVRRAVDRVENDVTTHLTLHTFMSGKQRRAQDRGPRPPLPAPAPVAPADDPEESGSG